MAILAVSLMGKMLMLRLGETAATIQWRGDVFADN
jgi:hypothetical protein